MTRDDEKIINNNALPADHCEDYFDDDDLCLTDPDKARELQLDSEAKLADEAMESEPISFEEHFGDVDDAVGNGCKRCNILQQHMGVTPCETHDPNGDSHYCGVDITVPEYTECTLDSSGEPALCFWNEWCESPVGKLRFRDTRQLQYFMRIIAVLAVRSKGGREHDPTISPLFHYLSERHMEHVRAVGGLSLEEYLFQLSL